MTTEDLKVWILAGQSNMEGCGLLKGCTPPDERIYSFTSAGNWELAEEPLHRFWESYTPVHQDLLRAWFGESADGKSDEAFAAEAAASRDRGAGLGLPFAIEMADATGGRVGLLPCAHGGTSLAQWSPELAAEQGTHCLYGAMLDRVRKAGGAVQGLLWYQGESDADPSSAATYQERLTRWIETVRGDVRMPNLPVILVQLGSFVAAPLMTPEMGQPWDVVRDALAAAAASIPNVAVVGAIDLELTDAIHLSTPGLATLGHRMALAAQKISAGADDCSAPRVTSLESVDGRWGMGCVRLRCEGVTGDWAPKHRMGGFAIYDAQGRPHPRFCIIEASADTDDAACISLMLNVPPDEPVWVGYGRGLNPYCNVVDSAGMGLLTFAMELGGAKA